jgi:hypothetical protein
MSLTDQLAQLSAANANVMGPAEVKSKHASDLYNAYLKAQDAAASAPDDLEAAQNAYYSYVQGADGYAATKSAENSAQFEKIRKQLTDMYKGELQKVNAALQAYDTTRLYAENLSTVSMRYMEDLMAALTSQTAAQSAEQKGYRSTYYLDQEALVVKKVNLAFNLLLISLALVFWKIFAYDAGRFFNPVALVGAVLIFFSSVITATVAYQIMGLHFPRNVYMRDKNTWSGTKLSQNYTY